MKIKNQVNVAVGLLITVFCVWLAVRKVPYNEITSVISGGNYYLRGAMTSVTVKVQ